MLPFIAVAGGIYAYIATTLIVNVRKSYVEASQIAQEVIGNIRTVQSFTGEERAVRSYKEALRNTYKYGRKAGLAKGLGMGTLQSLLFLSWALLVWYTSIVVHKNIANGGDSFTTMLNVLIAGVSLGMAAPDISAFLRAMAVAYPIFEMIERNTISKSSSETGQKLGKLEGHIEFRDVCFSYPSRPDVIIFNKFGLDIPSGKIVALVGGSGSGKSTVISLIERFYKPLSGTILLDGNDTRDLDLRWLRQQIGLVNQEPALFATSIRENILYGKDDATLDELTSAAKLSEAMSFIDNLPDGLETQEGRIVEIGSHEKLISNPNSAYASLVHLQEEASMQCHSSVSPTLGCPLRQYSGGLSDTRTSCGASFCSEKDSLCRAGADTVEPIRPKPVSLKRVYAMLGPDWIYGVVGTISAFVAGALLPLFALGMAQSLVAYYMDWHTTCQEIRKISILFCCGAVISIFAYAIMHLCFGIMGERLALRVREMMFSAILRNEIGWFDDLNNTSPMLTGRLQSDATLLQTITVDRTTILLHNVGLVVTSFIIAFILNWRITLVVIATYPLLISGHISEKLFMQGFGGNLSKAYLKANMLAGEAVSNIRTVAAFSAEEKILHLYARELVEPSNRSFLRGQIAGIFYGVCQFFIFSSYALALWYGSVLMGREISGFKSIMKSFFVLITTAIAMGETLAMAPDILKGDQMAASVFELLDRRTQVNGDAGEELKNVEGKIELRGVQFSYPSRPDILIFKDFDLRVCSGKSMALVGQSGSGKSSALALILRFYDPTAGKVMIDGMDIKKLKLKFLRKHIGLVQQEPPLFATSIYENILYGKEGASEAESYKEQGRSIF
ncbi:hypothetical protein OIU84_022541 [Salix udensis]|uniref:Uncharacterized protein n=1 Tax=Salix udensis TaxID=889485 RepID=A0AAD6KP83_9ROSI|nr:hypothetical protein OIU84_022541 [Salix udensis]